LHRNRRSTFISEGAAPLPDQGEVDRLQIVERDRGVNRKFKQSRAAASGSKAETILSSEVFPRSIFSAFDTGSSPPTFGAAKFWSPEVVARNEPTRRGSRDLLPVGLLPGFAPNPCRQFAPGARIA
jgi:hypothetical protein